MDSIKLTPFILFLILLIILVISSLFGKSLNVEREGFQEDQDSDNIEGMASPSILNYTSLPQYTSKHNVWNLYGNIYFDDVNANLIEVNNTQNNLNGGNTITDGNTVALSTTIVTDRDTYLSSINVSGTINQDLSQTNNIVPKYISCSYPTQTNNNNYTVFYIPWNKDTYIHIIDNIMKVHLSTFLFSPGSDPKIFFYPANTQLGLTAFVPDNNSENSNMVISPYYSNTKPVFQISNCVKYDITNSNLIIVNGGTPTNLSVYDVNNNMQSISNSFDTENNMSNNQKPTISSNFKPNIIMDNLGQNSILYIPTNNNVLIGLISYSDNTMTNYNLKNVCRFNEIGLDNGKINNTINSEYYKWFWYWNSSGTPGQTKKHSSDFNDYILKTQIVPPVCPTCPTCSSNGTCSNCGGNGGSGTLSKTGNSMIPDNSNNSTNNKNYSNVRSGNFDTNANPDTVGGSLTLATYDTVAGIEDVAKTGAGVVTGVAGTIGGVANNLINTTGSILKPGQSSKSGQSSNGTSLTNQRSTPGYTAPGLETNNQYSDPYSYYGQLPPKGAINYVPVTADFSRFGR